MKSIIAKKQKKPFDYEGAEAFALSPSDDGTVNNSYYFSAHDAKKNESLYVRLGLRSTHSEVWFYYGCGGGRYSLKRLVFQNGGSPLSVYNDGGWKIEFDGELEDGEGRTALARFNGAFEPCGEAVDFFTHMPPVRTAKAMAAEKWNKKFFAAVGENNQVHYEQFGSLSGVLTLGGEEIKIDLPCLRDHSFGKRDWSYMNNHLWLAAVDGDSQLNFSMVSYPAMTMLEVGNFKRHGKGQAFVLEADYNRFAVSAGVIPQNFEVKLKLDDKSGISVKTRLRDCEKYVFQDGGYELCEGIAEFDIDGKAYRGIFEIGVNGDKSRVFNGVKTEKLKR